LLYSFSESLPGQKNPRKHANFPTLVPDTYGYELDLDYEFKDKDYALEKAVELHKKIDEAILAH
jgi:hypothetical protein